ncbi:MAG TPA: hypothetical protein VK907_04885, partial [Phnomibacter sp.]|nr:hypothetical protein [Phnomibacter sp.]
MASKKYTLTALMLCFTLSGAFAQLAGPIDFMDSSKYRAKQMAQFNEWANGLPGAPFAPKPRDAWQLGIFGGYAGIFGDVNTAPGWGVGISARKSLGYTLSLRPSISYGKVTGLGYEKYYHVRNLTEPARARYQAAQISTYVHYYQTEIINPSLDLLVSLNNIMFHRKQSNYNFYALVGYSPISYLTSIEALDASGNPYTYNGVDFTGKRKDIKDQIKNLIPDPNFETKALTRARRNNFDDGEPGKRQWRHSVNVGAG